MAWYQLGDNCLSVPAYHHLEFSNNEIIIITIAIISIIIITIIILIITIIKVIIVFAIEILMAFILPTP